MSVGILVTLCVLAYMISGFVSISLIIYLDPRGFYDPSAMIPMILLWPFVTFIILLGSCEDYFFWLTRKGKERQQRKDQ